MPSNFVVSLIIIIFKIENYNSILQVTIYLDHMTNLIGGAYLW